MNCLMATVDCGLIKLILFSIISIPTKLVVEPFSKKESSYVNPD